jgi:hypothetical protein
MIGWRAVHAVNHECTEVLYQFRVALIEPAQAGVTENIH